MQLSILGFLSILLSIVLYQTLDIKNKYWKSFAVLILIGGFALRFYFAFVLSPPQNSLDSDMIEYFTKGNDIFKGVFHVGQNFWPLGYTLWGALLRTLGGWELLNWFQIFASWGTSLLIFLMALEYFGLTAGLFSLILASIHFPQISFVSYYLAESTYSFLITLSMWWILKSLKNEKVWKYFLTGVLLMVSFYFKGTHTLFVPLFCFWLVLRKKSEFKKNLHYILAMALGCFLVMAPQLIWTSYAYNKMMAGPSAGALNFVEGKCPWKSNQDPEGRSWTAPLFVQTGEGPFTKTWLTPFTDQAFFWDVGINCVKDEPVVLLTSVKYIYYLFLGNELWPSAFNDNFSFFYHSWLPVYYFILLPMGLFGFFLLRKKENDIHSLMALLMLSVFIMVYIFKSENRFRVPFDMTLIIWSSCALTWITEKIRIKFSR